MTFSYCQTTAIYVKSIRADVSTKSANSSLISILLNSKKNRNNVEWLQQL